MSRRNHLHDEMRWKAVSMLQAGWCKTICCCQRAECASQCHPQAVGPLPKGLKRHNGRRSLLVATQTPEDINSATAGVAALFYCRKAHIRPNCVPQTACRRAVRTPTCRLCAFVPSAHQSAVALGP
ncbi:hypothetical protein AVEN_215681-1 [Araneus ventricosus]|uniref:Uncharacterized protein n=1 Tax=Araneus ventricosus TaxID=182803 RepID=A0A4Y2MDC9_ARAVE|nr:hypothetical protein AVEN_215681-1 [Araneus ventricosus]